MPPSLAGRSGIIDGGHALGRVRAFCDRLRGMPIDLSRRELAAALAALAPAAAAASSAQTASNAETPAELLAQAKQGVERNHDALQRFKLDRAVEPATRYEA